ALALDAAAVVAPLSQLLSGIELDAGYAPVQLPESAGVQPSFLTDLVDVSFVGEQSTYLVRGLLPDDPDAQRAVFDAGARSADVVGVFADAAVEPCPICPGDPPKGSAADVASLLA